MAHTQAVQLCMSVRQKLVQPNPSDHTLAGTPAEGAHAVCRQVVPNFRVRTIPVLGTTPALFGQAAAAYVLCHLARQPFSPEPVFWCGLNCQLRVWSSESCDRQAAHAPTYQPFYNM